MSPETVTPEPTSTMPRCQALLRRGSQYYLNLKVPADLQNVFGKQIRKSLLTSDYKIARREVVRRLDEQLEKFDQARRAMKAGGHIKEAPTIISTLGEIKPTQAHKFASRYLALEERDFAEWMNMEGQWNPELLSELHTSLGEDAHHLSIQDDGRGGIDDGSSLLLDYLKSQGIECSPKDPAFRTLLPLFRAARIEMYLRFRDMVEGKPIRVRNHIFKDVHAYSPVTDEPIKRSTIADLIAFRRKVSVDLKLSSRSVDALKIPAKLLAEYFTGTRELDTLTRADMYSFFDILRKIPTRAFQRYPGKTILQAIAEADKIADPNRLATKTLQNYYVQVQTLFNNAVSEGLMKENPASSQLLRRTFFFEEETPPKPQFTTDQLNRLFRAPLYTGCKDDEFGYAKRGIRRPRRGRFWAPLLALFHGLRCNEACQILTGDVVTDGEITFIAIRELDEEGNQTIKKTKNKSSRRKVPVHPELIRIGFLDYVVKRREDKSSPALFPELPPGHRDYHSDAFSKWFSRFVKNTLGTGCKATFHSFRHQFRDAARDAEIPTESAEKLGGWTVKNGNETSDRYGGGSRQLSVLARHIAKVNYPGLDLSHLHVTSTNPKIPRSVVGRVRED